MDKKIEITPVKSYTITGLSNFIKSDINPETGWWAKIDETTAEELYKALKEVL